MENAIQWLVGWLVVVLNAKRIETRTSQNNIISNKTYEDVKLYVFETK